MVFTLTMMMMFLLPIYEPRSPYYKHQRSVSPAVTVAVAVDQGLASTDLVDARGGTAGHRSPEHAVLRVHVHLHGRVPAGVDDLAPDHLGDGGLVAFESNQCAPRRGGATRALTQARHVNVKIVWLDLEPPPHKPTLGAIFRVASILSAAATGVTGGEVLAPGLLREGREWVVAEPHVMLHAQSRRKKVWGARWGWKQRHTRTIESYRHYCCTIPATSVGNGGEHITKLDHGHKRLPCHHRQLLLSHGPTRRQMVCCCSGRRVQE